MSGRNVGGQYVIKSRDKTAAHLLVLQ